MCPNCLPEMMHNRTGCICLSFLQCVFSNVSSNYRPERIQSHTACLSFLHYVFFKCTVKLSARENSKSNVSSTLLLSPFMKVIWNFRFNTSKNYNVNFDLDLRAASSVRISETKRDFGVGPKPQHSLCSRVSPTLSWKWPSVHARARFGSVYFLMASFGVF